MSNLDKVYRKFGETSEAAQLLETELGNILLDIKVVELDLFQIRDKDLAQRVLQKINRSTLGGLLKSVEKEFGGSKKTLDILRDALNERNRLFHSFYREHNFRTNSAEGCEMMFQDLDRMHGLIFEAYKLTLALSGVDLDNPERLTVQLPTTHVPI